MLGSSLAITFRTTRAWDVVPGEIARVDAYKQWMGGGDLYLSGAVLSSRLDAKALSLVPLELKPGGIWDPLKHFWGDRDQPIEKWAKAIIAWGPRPLFEMQQILPGDDPEDFHSDPIIKSNDLKDSGDWAGARKILMDLCQSDLRCLDAHSHLGNLRWDTRPSDAIRHYEAGFRIGELSLGENFGGLLPWGRIDNRPFLRCMNGYGLSLWRLKRFKEAVDIFERMLWLNPSDNQGVRLILDDVRAGSAWKDRPY